MKVIILGPSVNENSSGGVAIFSESLYEGFKNLGDEVYFISLCPSKKFECIHFNKKQNKKTDIIFYGKKIAKKIRNIKPDMVISSVQYSMPIKTYKRYYPHATYVQVLHGVAWPLNGFLKASLVNGVAKYSRKHFDKVVTVSYLSYALNLQYNGFKCDKIIHNGCNMTPYYENDNRSIDFCYIGRLFSDKQVELLSDAFTLLKKEHPELRVVVAGFGEMEHMFTKGKYVNSGIEFIGKLNQEECQKIYRQTKIFISMHPTETFGTVFNEAILNGANIATCSTTGVAGLYFNSPYFHVVDKINALDLASGLYTSLTNFKIVDKDYIKQMADYLSYTRVAKEYKSLLISK